MRNGRITVEEILRKLADGMTPEEIISDHPHPKPYDIYDPVDLPSFQKNGYNILCAMLEWAALYCILIFKIGLNQQSHICCSETCDVGLIHRI